MTTVRSLRWPAFVGWFAVAMSAPAACSSSSGGASPGDGGAADSSVGDDASQGDGGAQGADGSHGKVDGAADARSDGGCAPAPLPSGWQPPPLEPPKPSPDACSAQDISDFLSSCTGSSASPAKCAAWRAANAACNACLVTPSTDPAWGASVLWSTAGVVNLNVSACIAVTDPSNTACQAAVQAQMQCEHLACDSSCPASGGYAAWSACAQAADADECNAYALSTSFCLQNLSGPDTACAPTNFADDLVRVGLILCGPSGDGGAGEGGSSDAAPGDAAGGDSGAGDAADGGG